MNPVTIVVLGKYPEIFKTFHDSAARCAPDVPKILVRDGHEIPDPPGWTVVQGLPEFNLPANANRGWRTAPKDHDLLYSGDDVQLLEPGCVELLRELAYSDPKVGILSPKTIGADRLQANPPACCPVAYSSHRLAFVCVYIKRVVIDAVGYMDERFSGYGHDDDDMCLRTQQAGFQLAVTAKVTVRHDHPTASFRRNHGGDYAPVRTMMERNREVFHEKYRDRTA